MPPPNRRPTGAFLGSLVVAVAMLSAASRPATADPGRGGTPIAAAERGTVYAHAGLPEWAEAGYRSAAERELHGTIERGRDATGPTFVLVEPDGRRLRIAYANNGDKALEAALRNARGSVCTLRGTVLDWGRGVRSFDMGKPLTIRH